MASYQESKNYEAECVSFEKGSAEDILRAKLSIYKAYYNDDEEINNISQYLINYKFAKVFNDFIRKYIEHINKSGIKGANDVLDILNVSLTILVNYSFSNDHIKDEIKISEELMNLFGEIISKESCFVKEYKNEHCLNIIYDVLCILANISSSDITNKIEIKESLLHILECKDLSNAWKTKLKFICLEVYFLFFDEGDKPIDTDIIKKFDNEVRDMLVKFLKSIKSKESDLEFINYKYFSEDELKRFVIKSIKCEALNVNIRNKLIKLNNELKLSNHIDEIEIKEDEKWDVFLSYCHADKAIVKRIHSKFLAKGLKVWIDFEYMDSGHVTKLMVNGIKNSKCFCCALSDGYQKSENCVKELQFALKTVTDKARIIPVKVKEFTMTDELDFDIGQLNRRKLTNESTFNEEVESIISNIKKLNI